MGNNRVVIERPPAGIGIALSAFWRSRFAMASVIRPAYMKTRLCVR